MIAYKTTKDFPCCEARVTQLPLLRQEGHTLIVGYGYTEKGAFIHLVRKLKWLSGFEMTRSILLDCKLLQCERQWLAGTDLSFNIPTGGT